MSAKWVTITFFFVKVSIKSSSSSYNNNNNNKSNLNIFAQTGGTHWIEILRIRRRRRSRIFLFLFLQLSTTTTTINKISIKVFQIIIHTVIKNHEQQQQENNYYIIQYDLDDDYDGSGDDGVPILHLPFFLEWTPDSFSLSISKRCKQASKRKPENQQQQQITYMSKRKE